MSTKLTIEEFLKQTMKANWLSDSGQEMFVYEWLDLRYPNRSGYTSHEILAYLDDKAFVEYKFIQRYTQTSMSLNGYNLLMIGVGKKKNKEEEKENE
jgi:hypothetical protein